jgi:hypothetical protein
MLLICSLYRAGVAGAFTNANAFGWFAHTVGMKVLRPVLLSPDPLLLVLEVGRTRIPDTVNVFPVK